jgi:hypothetical protein
MVDTMSVVKETGWNVRINGMSAHALKGLDKLRYKEDDLMTYVSQCYCIVRLCERRPWHFTLDEPLRFGWRLDNLTYVFPTIRHEFIVSATQLVQQLLRAKIGDSDKIFWAARCVYWLILPQVRKLRDYSPETPTCCTESGAKQLLTMCLIKVHLESISRWERKPSGSVGVEMMEWVIKHCIALQECDLSKRTRTALTHIQEELEATQFLYIEPDNEEHKIAMAIEAKIRFNKVGNTERAKQAGDMIPDICQIIASDTHKPIKPTGLSDMSALQRPLTFKKMQSWENEFILK